jgi:hypothetical protein
MEGRGVCPIPSNIPEISQTSGNLSQNLKTPVSKIRSETGTGSSFGIVMRLRVEGVRSRGCTAYRGKGIFLFSKALKPTCGFTQPHIRCVMGIFLPGGKAASP